MKLHLQKLGFGLVIHGLLAITLPAATEGPEEELATFQMAEGFVAHLFASEADGIINPIQCRFDPQGRLYVACSLVYPQLVPGDKADDRIVMLEDTDRDGQSDRSTVFADGLFIPTGLEWGDGGIYVGNATELIHLRDTDGDGKADQRRVVMRGFGTGDSHQNINSFHWSPGGELWFSQGLHARSRVETPWGVSKLDHAGVWRWRPRRQQLDGFFGGGMAPHNPWGFVHDDWFRLIVVAGNGHGIYDPLPVLIRGHRQRDVRQIWDNFRGRKLCGIDLVQNAHFPESWQGFMVAGGFINNAIYTLRMEEDGAGLKVRDEAPLIVSSSTSFRPVDVKFGPDGALYIADWCNPIIGHYQASFRHPDRDKTHGRIWRVTANNRPLAPAPNVAGLSVPETLDRLKSEDHWTRYQARRLLADMDTGVVTTALKSWVAGLSEKDPRLEHHLLEALALYETHEVPEPGLLQCLLGAQDPRARAYAATVVGRWSDRLADPLALLRQSVQDAHPRVRLAAVVAAGDIPRAASVEVAMMAADRDLDDFLTYALEQVVFVLKPQWLPAFQSGQLLFENHPHRLEFLLQADGTPDTLQALRRLLDRDGLAGNTRESFLNLLVEVGQPDDLRRILAPAEFNRQGRYDDAMHARVLEKLGQIGRLRRVRPSGNLASDLVRLAQSDSTSVAAAAYRLAGAWELSEFAPRLTDVARGSGRPMELRLAAVQGLGGLDSAASARVLVEISTAESSAELRVAALVALIPRQTGQAAELTARWWSETNQPDSVKALLPAFLQRTEGAAPLSAALRAQPPTSEMAQMALRWMSETGRGNDDLRAVLMAAAGRPGQGWNLTADEVAALTREVETAGDAQAGAQIFRRAELGCLSCHTIGDEGGRIGPDLNSIGAGQPVDFIIGAILEPNREVKESFEATEITTKDNEMYEGFLVRSDAREVVIRDVATSEEVRIRKDNVASLRDRGSLMPAGLVDSLSRTEFRDLVRYLSELGKPRL